MTQTQSRSNLILRLNTLLASSRELLELRIHRLSSSHLEQKSYSLSKAQLIGTALIPWKEAAAASVADGGASKFFAFHEKVYQRKDDILYFE